MQHVTQNIYKNRSPKVWFANFHLMTVELILFFFFPVPPLPLFLSFWKVFTADQQNLLQLQVLLSARHDLKAHG